jgi:hypothetical protein
MGDMSAPVLLRRGVNSTPPLPLTGVLPTCTSACSPLLGSTTKYASILRLSVVEFSTRNTAWCVRLSGGSYFDTFASTSGACHRRRRQKQDPAHPTTRRREVAGHAEPGFSHGEVSALDERFSEWAVRQRSPRSPRTPLSKLLSTATTATLLFIPAGSVQ